MMRHCWGRMGRMWDVAWTKDESAIVEESEEDDEQLRFRDFLRSGNFDCCKEVNGRGCCLLYCEVRREKYLPKSSIEKRRVFRSWLMRDSWGSRWSHMRESVRSQRTRLPSSAVWIWTVSDSHAPLLHHLEMRRFRFACFPFCAVWNQID